MNKCLITRPDHDKVTSYLFQWTKNILKINSTNIQFLNLEGKEANRERVESYLKKQDPRLVLFNGHGSYNLICGFKNEILIEMGKNDELLKEKIVYALSCSSARKLGPSAVEKGAEAFIGYKNPFVLYTNSDSEATPLKDDIAASFLNPSNRVSFSLLKGNTAQEASNKSKEEFKREIRKHSASSSIFGSDMIVAGLLWDMNSQVVLGKRDARI